MSERPERAEVVREVYWVMRNPEKSRMSWTYYDEAAARDAWTHVAGPGWELARVQGATWTLIAQTAGETAA